MAGGSPFGTAQSVGEPSPLNRESDDKLKVQVAELEAKNMDLLQVNSSMSKQILSLQGRADQFEERISTYKKYKWMLHNAAGIQCLQCS